VRPAVGIQYGVVERGVEVVEHFGIFQRDNRAGGTVPPGFQITRFAFEVLTILDKGIVEVGEGAFLQDLCADGAAVERTGRVEPFGAEVVQAFGGSGDGLHARIFLRLFSGRPGEGEGFKICRWSIPRAVFQ